MTTVTQPAVERFHPPPKWAMAHVVNPIARKVLRTSHGKMSENVMLLRFTGRKTGRRYEVPVGYRRLDDRLVLITQSRWRHNFTGGAVVELTLQGRRRTGHATLEEDPAEVGSILERLVEGLEAGDEYPQLGLKVHVDRRPTSDELAEMARRSHLAIVWVDLT